jgi:hypothetical protein
MSVSRAFAAVVCLALVHGEISDEVGGEENPFLIDCKSMKIKQLRAMLGERGLKCAGCAEKADYVSMCEKHKADPPKREEVNKPPPAKSQEDIDDMFANLKNIPGMENLNIFNGEDLLNMKPEEMAKKMGGGGRGGGGRGGGPRMPTRISRAEAKTELEDFYNTYGLQDKLDGVDAALDKWVGQYEAMFRLLNKKYKAEVEAYQAADQAHTRNMKSEPLSDRDEL